MERDILTHYLDVCKTESIDPSDAIKKVMQWYTKQNILKENNGFNILYLAGNNKLVGNIRLTDDDILCLYKTLQTSFHKINILDLRFNSISDKGAQQLAKLLEENLFLKDLNLTCNDIGEIGAEHIANALKFNETLKCLNMNGNKIGKQGGLAFAAMLGVNQTIETLNLGSTDIEIHSLIALSIVLNVNHVLKELNISKALIYSKEEEISIHYANMLKNNKGLEKVCLKHLRIQDLGAERISEALCMNYTLTFLDLSFNRITRDGAKFLSNALRQNCSVRILNLNGNRLENEGAIFISEALSFHNTNLENLSLTHNCIDGEGLCSILNALEHNSTLTNLYIWGNNLEPSACDAINQRINCGRLELKNIDVEPFMVDDVTYLAQLSHSINEDDYFTPSYGYNANPVLKRMARLSP